MVKIIEEKVSSVQRKVKCESCGRLEPAPHNAEGLESFVCYTCKTNERIREQEAAAPLIGAVVTAFEMQEQGVYTSWGVLDSLTLHTKDGKKLVLKAAGYDERYIDVEEQP